MRTGEVFVLTWNDIDLDNRIIKISKTVYAKDKEVIETKKEITKIVFSHKGILQMHGFYLDEEEKSISFDIIIDFKVKNREELYKNIFEEVQNKFNKYKIDITLDIDVSD